MIQAKVIIGIHHLNLSPNTTIKFIDQVVLSNDKKILDSLFKNKSIIEVIGLNEIQSLYDHETFLYIETPIESNDDDFDDRTYLINQLLLVELLCQSFWLIKDNSIKSELGHLIYSSEKRLRVHSNMWNTSYTNCLGISENVTFSKEEITEATCYFPAIFNSLHAKSDFNPSIKLTSKTNRLGRCFYFLQSARNKDDIGTKLSHYCSVMESLFSISNFELKHRLSETIALFLSKEKEERLIIYKTIQSAYDIRSAIVHGDSIPDKFLKNDYKLLKETVELTDIYIRRCVSKILESEDLLKLFTEQSKEKVIEYVQNLVFV